MDSVTPLCTRDDLSEPTRVTQERCTRMQEGRGELHEEELFRLMG
jgi:hypothetical protein